MFLVNIYCIQESVMAASDAILEQMERHASISVSNFPFSNS